MRVVVTGLGVVTGLSCKVEDFWSRLLAGESGVHPLTLLDTGPFKVKFGGDVPNWSMDGYLEKHEARRIDRFTQFAVVGAVDAVNDSGLQFDQEDPFRCGVVLGSGIGGLTEMEEQILKLVQKGPDRVSPFTIPKLMLNAGGGNISIRYGLRGPNFSVATACASATNAMGEAFRLIAHGDADVLVTGGTEAAITQMGLAGFQNMRALSMRNEDPARASRPFDSGRDGFVLSEGAGILVFEELEHAKKRGAKIYAEVLGYGASADGSHITAPDENGTGAARAMSNALRDAQLNPSDIGYINAHGTSTPLGDKAETQAIKNVFGDAAKSVSVSSTKSMLGHTLGASGGIEAIVCVKSLNDGKIHPTINLTEPDPDCDLDYTPNVAKEKKFTAAMSNSFGFGGHNASIVLGTLR